jgi:predicted CXXCH cytochrome family protein
VFRFNIPKTCGTCHGDTTLMKARGRRNAFAEFMSSVHAHELFDEGNLRAPTCVSCHGVHGAAPPGAGDVDKVCGQCHTAERRYYGAGPHRKGMLAQGLPECASCHGDHAIAVAKPERLGSLCVTCHGAGSAQEGLGRKLLTDYRNAAQEIDRADGLIDQAEQVPLQTEDYKARLEEARTYLREALPAAHSLQEETVAGFTARARSVGAEIEHEIYAKLGNLRVRKFVLILFWFYVLLTIVILRRFRSRGSRAE